MLSVIYGSDPCVFAFGGITEVVTLALFLNFDGITWVSPDGNILYGLYGTVLVAIFNMQDPNRDFVMR
ncbi:MAG: hypothetical protein AAGA97_06520 [Pseudomonadota bacterium]